MDMLTDSTDGSTSPRNNALKTVPSLPFAISLFLTEVFRTKNPSKNIGTKSGI
jgi:hypothetical protein